MSITKDQIVKNFITSCIDIASQVRRSLLWKNPFKGCLSCFFHKKKYNERLEKHQNLDIFWTPCKTNISLTYWPNMGMGNAPLLFGQIFAFIASVMLRTSSKKWQNFRPIRTSWNLTICVMAQVQYTSSMYKFAVQFQCSWSIWPILDNVASTRV